MDINRYSKKVAWLLGLGALLSFPSTSVASTVTIASPISTGLNPTIDLTTYGNNNATFLNGAYTVYWTAHLTDPTPNLEIAIDIQTAGWFGFGFADPASGGMPGSDIGTFTVIPNATHYVTSVTDRYAVVHGLPAEDDVNNFNLKAGWQSADKNRTIVVFTRALNTGDTQDRVITGGDLNVVMAYNADGSTTVSYHGPNKHAYSIEFFPDSSDTLSNPGETVYTWNYTNPATTITAVETRYVCTTFTFSPPPLADGSEAQGQIIEIAPIVDPNTTSWVHHYVVYGCLGNTTKFQSFYGKPTECLTNDVPIQDICPEVVFAWAVGSGPLVFPLNVGAVFGDPTDPSSIKYLAIEVHYNNPLEQPVNITDESGLSFKYITSRRQYNSGTIQLGDPTVNGDPMKFGPSSFIYEFICPGECTSQWPSDITIFGSFLHAHSYGSQLVATVTSGGVLSELSRSDFYDFAFQHISVVNKTIKRGDRLNLHCNYDLSTNLFSSDPLHKNDTAVTFGLGSENEMCLNYVYYYPRFNESEKFSICGGYANQTICNYDSRLDIQNPVQPGDANADPSWIMIKKFGLNASAASALQADWNSTTTSGSTAVGAGVMYMVAIAIGLAALL